MSTSMPPPSVAPSTDMANSSETVKKVIEKNGNVSVVSETVTKMTSPYNQSSPRTRNFVWMYIGGFLVCVLLDELEDGIAGMNFFHLDYARNYPAKWAAMKSAPKGDPDFQYFKAREYAAIRRGFHCDWYKMVAWAMIWPIIIGSKGMAIFVQKFYGLNRLEPAPKPKTVDAIGSVATSTSTATPRLN